MVAVHGALVLSVHDARRDIGAPAPHADGRPAQGGSAVEKRPAGQTSRAAGETVSVSAGSA